MVRPQGVSAPGMTAGDGETMARIAGLPRRGAILAAALACFAERGYAATAIDDIRARSAASVGSLYHHFGSKDGIAAALYIHCLEDYRDGLGAAIAAAASAEEAGVGEAERVIRAVVRHHLVWASGNPDKAGYLHTMRREIPIVAIEGSIRRATADFLWPLKQRFRAYRDAGEIVDLPGDLLTAQLVGPAQELVRLWLAGRSRIEPRDAAGALADAAWAALKPGHRPAAGVSP